MPSGKAPIGERDTVAALFSQRWSHRQSLPGGIVSLLTLVCWAGWLYLVLPLLSLLLWVFGIRLFVREFAGGGYQGLLGSLAAYSSVLLVLVGGLALWIVWNVVRYGGTHDRRTIKSAEVTDPEVAAAFHLDESVLPLLRGERRLRIDLDRDGCVVVVTNGRSPVAGAAEDLPIPAGAAQRAQRNAIP